VKQITFILILQGYLFSFTELRELLKLPILLEHYIEHNSADKSISFADFLSMHYLQVQDNDGDDEQDRNLPFKSCHNSHTTTFALSCTHQNIQLKPHEIIIHKNYYSHQELFLTNFHPSIWQPPKL
jgi:hypothetical protein